MQCVILIDSFRRMTLNQLFRQMFFFMVCLVPINLLAAVQIEVENNNLKETIWSDGSKLHVKSSQEPAYILVNAEQRRLYTINHKEKQIINLSDEIKKPPVLPEIQDVKIDFFRHGPGPNILGFETELYLLKANGKICRTEYLSKAVAELTGAIAGLELMTEYRMSTTFGTLPNELELCFTADHLTYQRYRKGGFPLKSEDQFGKTMFEIISIKKDSNNPIDNFKLPERYTVMSYKEMMDSSELITVGAGTEMHPLPVSEDRLSR